MTVRDMFIIGDRVRLRVPDLPAEWQIKWLPTLVQEAGCVVPYYGRVRGFSKSAWYSRREDVDIEWEGRWPTHQSGFLVAVANDQGDIIYDPAKEVPHSDEFWAPYRGCKGE